MLKTLIIFRKPVHYKIIFNKTEHILFQNSLKKVIYEWPFGEKEKTMHEKKILNNDEEKTLNLVLLWCFYPFSY